MLAILGISSVTEAFWRMECRGNTGVARIDPIVDFAKVAGHAHTVQGSSGELSYLSITCYISLLGWGYWAEWLLILD